MMLNTGSIDFSGAQMAIWCGDCYSNPAIGEVKFEEAGEEQKMSVCLDCIRRMASTQDIPGWTGEFDKLDFSKLV